MKSVYLKRPGGFHMHGLANFLVSCSVQLHKTIMIVNQKIIVVT